MQAFCKGIRRPEAARTVFRLLRELSYHGFAEPELKKDPRDGQYTLLEINSRTTLKLRKVHSVAAWDDPLPFVVRVAGVLWAGLRRVSPRWTVKTVMDDR